MTETLTSFAHGSVASMQWLDHTGSAKAIPVVQLQEDLRKLIAEHADTRTQLERKSDAVQRLWAERDALRAQVDELGKDAERLDWLEKNLFHRENVDWITGKLSESQNMWVTFTPVGVQGAARTIIDAAIDAQKGK